MSTSTSTHYLKPSGRTIPNFILRHPGLTSADKLVLAIIHHAPRDCLGLTNLEIARRAGLKEDDRAVQERLKRLERRGLIRRTGAHRGRTIALLLEDDGMGSLTVPEEILRDNSLSPAQKLIVSVMTRFDKVKNWRWWPQRIGMDPQTWKYNLRKIPNPIKKKPPRFLSENPPDFYKEPPRKLAGYSIEGIRSSRALAKASVQPAAGQEGFQSHSVTGEINMQPENYSAYVKSSTTSCSPSRARTKPAKPTPKVPEEIAIELEYEVFQKTHLQRHKPGSGAYQNAVRVVKALKGPKGLSSFLDADQQRTVLAHLEKFGISRPEAEAAIRHRFTNEERIELYDRLDKTMNPDYGYRGKYKKISLRDAAYLMNWENSYSPLLLAWLRPPQLRRELRKSGEEAIIEKSRELTVVFNQLSKFLPNNGGPRDRQKIAAAAIALQEHHAAHVKRILTVWGLQRHLDRLDHWVPELLEFAERNFPYTPHVGWLKPGSEVMRKWVESEDY